MTAVRTNGAHCVAATSLASPRSINHQLISVSANYTPTHTHLLYLRSLFNCPSPSLCCAAAAGNCCHCKHTTHQPAVTHMSFNLSYHCAWVLVDLPYTTQQTFKHQFHYLIGMSYVHREKQIAVFFLPLGGFRALCRVHNKLAPWWCRKAALNNDITQRSAVFATAVNYDENVFWLNWTIPRWAEINGHL